MKKSFTRALNISTIVTGTASDPSGQPYANGTWQATFVPAPGSPPPYQVNGQPIVLSYSGSLDSNGSFSVTVADNTAVEPVGSQWKFTVCPDSSFQCTSYTTTVSGVSLDITSGLQQVIKSMVGVINPTEIVTSYQDSFISQTSDGDLYFNTSTGDYRFWYSGAWHSISGGTGGGGIVSINANTNPAQLIVGGAGITVTSAGGTTTISLTPPAIVLGSITANPASIQGGNTSVGTATLINGVAPTGGALVTLSSNNAAVTVPASVTIPAGSTSATFTITTTTVAVNTSVTITGNYGGARTATVTVLAPPQPVYGGFGISGGTSVTSAVGTTITLNNGVVLNQIKASAEVPGDQFTISPPLAGAFIYFCLTGSNRTFIAGGLPVDMNPVITVTVSGRTMYLYQTQFALSGTFVIIVQ